MNGKPRKFLPRSTTWRLALRGLWSVAWPVLFVLMTLGLDLATGVVSPRRIRSAIPVLVLAVCYGCIGLLCLFRQLRRPKEYRVGAEGLTIVRRFGQEQLLPLELILNARVVTARDIRSRRCRRLDAGWYEPLRDAERAPMVYVELRHDRPVVLAPDQPEAFVESLEANLLEQTGATGAETGLFLTAPLSLTYRRIQAAYVCVLLLALTVSVIFDVGYGVFPLIFVGAAAVYEGVCLFLRPDHFRILPDGLRIGWAFRHRLLGRQQIQGVRMVSAAESGRLGVPHNLGVLGFFGRTRSERLGPVEAYITEKEAMVLIERRNDRPLLITPERPGVFVEILGRVLQTPG